MIFPFILCSRQVLVSVSYLFYDFLLLNLDPYNLTYETMDEFTQQSERRSQLVNKNKQVLAKAARLEINVPNIRDGL